MKYQKWHIGTASEQDTALLKEAGYPSLLATVLAARGITTAEAAAEALERETSLTISPMLMRDMDKAVARIQKALANDETIAVFGDYDVDGITSTVLLLDYLKNCGAKCLRYIPRRIEDGYGLSKDAIQGLRDKGVTLMITVDCGITGNEEIDFAASIGMDVVVTDHHECKENLPRAVAVVDPHRPDDTYPFKYLAGVGVALKLVLALGGPDRENALFARYCTLAAIGTIADVMRMEGENRTIVSCGLAALNHTDFVGIHALLKEAGLLGKPITSIQIGFVLSPRINAAGRMGAADLAADLLQETDPAKAEELAKQLCDLNRERQAVEQSICADAIAQIERLRPEERNGLGLSSAQSMRALKLVAEALGFKDPDEMYVHIGTGKEKAQHVTNRLLKILVDKGNEEAEKPTVGTSASSTGIMAPMLTSVKRPKKHETHSSQGIVVKGVDDVLVRLSRCCNPVPGDDILGFVTRGRGVSVHRADCPNALDLKRHPERIIEVEWEGTPTAATYQVEIYIEALDRMNLLLDVTRVISEMGANVLSCNTTTHRDGMVEMRFLFQLSDLAVIERMTKRLSAIDGVFDARRMMPQGSSKKG